MIFEKQISEASIRGLSGRILAIFEIDQIYIYNIYNLIALNHCLKRRNFDVKLKRRLIRVEVPFGHFLD